MSAPNTFEFITFLLKSQAIHKKLKKYQQLWEICIKYAQPICTTLRNPLLELSFGKSENKKGCTE